MFFHLILSVVIGISYKLGILDLSFYHFISNEKISNSLIVVFGLGFVIGQLPSFRNIRDQLI